jgi:hypothetical protein
MKHLKKYKLYYLLSLIFFLASFRGSETGTEAETYKVPSLISLVQGISTYIVIGAMIISLIWCYKYKFRFQSYFIDAICFFIFFVILILSGNSFIEEIFFRLIFSLITLLYFINVIPKLQLKFIILFVAIGSIGFTFVNFLSFFLLPETIWKGRLYGVSAHPNFTGVASTISGVFSLYYVGKVKKLKLLKWVPLGISITVCIFSGSRNSFFSLIFAFFVFIFLKCKNISSKVLLCLVFLLIIILLINFDFSVSSLDYEGRGNTREGTWKEMVDNALELPFFGKGRTGATSNSYLFALIASGLIGFVFFIRSFIGLFKRITSKKIRNGIYFSLFIMLTASLSFSSLFEGFLLDQISLPVFSFWLLLVIPFTEKKQIYRFNNNSLKFNVL